MPHEPPNADENPFSTRFVRPGAVEYLFADHTDVEQLLTRWRAAGRRGQIVGPHGSGKSTLLTALLARLGAAGRPTFRCDLRDGQRSLPNGWLGTHGRDSRSTLAIDGYEQLSRWQRHRVRTACRRHGLGLIVTAHAPVGLPMLWTTAVDAPRAMAQFQRLMIGSPPLVTESDLRAALASHPKDLRAVWFALYDLYEERRRTAGGGG